MSDHHKHMPSCHSSSKKKFDFLLWGSLLTIATGYILYWLFITGKKQSK
jgi:hypothetical protein